MSLDVTWPEVRDGMGGNVLLGLSAMEFSGVCWEARGGDWTAGVFFARVARLAGLRFAGRLAGMLFFPC
jgi:hypothetical protein